MCTPYNHALVTASLYSKPHTKGVCVFNCNLPPALLAEWPGSFTFYFYRGEVNMVLNVHRNHKAYWGQGEVGKWDMEAGGEGDYIPIITLSPSE